MADKYSNMCETKMYLRKYWDRDDIIEIVNKAIHYGQRLNMYHTYDNGIIYIKLTYTDVPLVQIYCELLFGDFCHRNGDKEKKIYCLQYNSKIIDVDLIEVKSTNIDKIQRYISERSVIIKDQINR